MAQIRNVLFIMCDQLRADHLGCAGHPFLKTPNIDALARRGVRFSNAFVVSNVCGPSRMSFYTGRYPSSHGATWNRVPLDVGEVTLGEYLRASGQRLVLAGKTHVMPDVDGLARLQIEASSELGHLLERGGFEEIDRYDGHHPPGEESGYPAYLRANGYDSADPWTDFVIAADGPNGEVLSGWHMRHVHLPARVKEEHSETAYMTDQAIDFMRVEGDEPWALHLSYVKPHWPYMAPAPYHAMYSADQCLPAARTQAELRDAHPVVAAYRQHEESQAFARDDCVRVVRPAYQGLIHQIDDHLGRLFDAMQQMGRLDDTLIVFTADHGDFLGDHWLGEKELFYDTVQRVPLIVVDPSAAADATRGTLDERLIESIDVLPTILASLGIAAPRHRVEGVALQPLLHGRAVERWRDAVFCELDWSFKAARRALGMHVQQCRAWCIRTARWRYVYWLDQPEQLFDLAADPGEFTDLGREATHASVRDGLRTRLFDWLARRKRRTTISDERIEQGTDAHKRAGVFYGQW
jgi:arylsulfatase A-like enzyme